MSKLNGSLPTAARPPIEAIQVLQPTPASLSRVAAMGLRNRVAVAAILFAGLSQGWASPIPITSVAGFPNGRTYSGDLLPNAIDGDISTFTWTTNPNNIASPSHLAIGFDSTTVNRLRLWKSAYGGGGWNSKNLTIQYSTGGGPLESRTWTTVSNLTNGFLGAEFLHATTVNSNGTVTGDVHESDGAPGDGWASLTFDSVTATGLRISFSNPGTLYGGYYCDGLLANEDCNHYRVGEFEAHSDAPAVLTVAIDIKPGSFPNSINPGNQGVIPVAILTTNTFDAATVNPATARFGPNSAMPQHASLEDVDGDNRLDMVLQFRSQATGIVCGNTSATLTGTTTGGQAIKGSDSVNTTGCK